MALAYKTRRRLSLLVLLVGMPAYIVLVWGILGRMALWQLPTAVEFIIYVLAGTLWIFPLKPVFRGVGQPDPEARD